MRVYVSMHPPRTHAMYITKFLRTGSLRIGVRTLAHGINMVDKRTNIQPPQELLKPMNIPFKYLFGPGPTNPSTKIYNACAMSLLGHFHAEFFKIMDEVKAGLQYVFQTNNKYTLAVTGSGHAAMEASIMNVVERGERILVCVNGLWGLRARDIAERQGCDVQVLEKPVGEAFTKEEIELALRQHRPVAMFITHSESSGGVCQPLEGVGKLCHSYGCLVIVDAVASLAGVPFFTDEWELDVVYSGSQKVLGSPPGVSPITFSPRAMEKVKSRKTKVQSFYLDIQELGNYWGCDNNPRRYHHTAAVNLIYALRESLSVISEAGLESFWKRHKENGERLWAGLEAIGFQCFVKDKSVRLPTVTTVAIPDGFPDWKVIPRYLMTKYNVEVAGGLGSTIGKVWRIGFMGHNSQAENVDLVLRLFKEAVDVAHGRVKSQL